MAPLLLLAGRPASAGLWDAISEFQKPNMKLGQLEIHPYVKFTEMYDSNIFLQPTSRVVGQNANNNQAAAVLGSAISETNGGLKLALPISEAQKFSVNYDVTWRAYEKDPRINNAVIQAVEGMYSYKGPSFSLRVMDSYLNTVDPASNELTARNQRWQNIVGGGAEYAPEQGNLFIAADGNHTAHKYIVEDPAIRGLLNRYEQVYGGRVGVKLQPKTRLYFAYHRQVIHYTVFRSRPTKNSKAHLMDMGLEGEIAPKVSGVLEGGFNLRRYDDPPSAGLRQIVREGRVMAKLKWKALERTTIDATASRSLQEATFATNKYYVATGGGLTLTHKFPFKVTATATSGVEIDRYPQPSLLNGFSVNRRDDLWQGGLTLDYDIQEWLKLGAGYLYRARFSTWSEQFSYRDQQTTGSLSITF